MIIRTIKDLINGEKIKRPEAPVDCEGSAAAPAEEEEKGNKIVVIDPTSLLGASGSPTEEPRFKNHRIVRRCQRRKSWRTGPRIIVLGRDEPASQFRKKESH